MRKLPCVLVLAIVGLFATRTLAQEKAKSTDGPKTASAAEPKTETAQVVVPLKVTVVFSEFDGEKKLSSLPYTLFLKAEENHHFTGVVRMGVRVPVAIGKDQSSYQDIGSNLDCQAQLAADGKYLLDLTVDRSSLYSGPGAKEDHSADQSLENPSRQPIVRTFRASLALMLRDGQTTQSTVATDPLNGHTVRVDVTLNVLK